MTTDKPDEWTTEQLHTAREKAEAVRARIDTELRRRGEADDPTREARRWARMTDAEFMQATRKAAFGSEE